MLGQFCPRLSADEVKWARNKKTYVCTTLEDDGFMARSFAISKCAYSLGRLIRIRGEKLVKAFVPEVFKEPLAT